MIYKFTRREFKKLKQSNLAISVKDWLFAIAPYFTRNLRIVIDFLIGNKNSPLNEISLKTVNSKFLKYLIYGYFSGIFKSYLEHAPEPVSNVPGAGQSNT